MGKIQVRNRLRNAIDELRSLEISYELGTKDLWKSTKRFVSAYKTSALLMGSIVAIHAFANHYDVPGYGIPYPFSEYTTPVETLHSIGLQLSQGAYNLSETISDATIHFDPSKPFAYKEIFQNVTFGFGLNTFHHTWGGLAVGYTVKKHLIDPLIRSEMEDRRKLQSSTLDAEEYLQRSEKRMKLLAAGYFWGSVSAIAFLWEGWEMNLSSDRLFLPPVSLSDPHTWDGVKDIICDYTGAAAVWYGPRIKNRVSGILKGSAETETSSVTGGGKL